jgi:cholesterol transport system auxiliary component
MIRMGCAAAVVRLLPLSLVLLVTAGCGSGPPLRPDVYFALDPEPIELPIGPPVSATLLIGDLAARGFLGGRQIVFRTEEEPLRVQRYDGLLWADPVPRALSRNLARAVRAAEVYAFTLIPADRGTADVLLGGEVGRFEHLPSPDPTRAPSRVVGTLNLVLVRAEDRRSLWERVYHRELAVEGDTPDAMALAFNRLAALLAADLVRDLRRDPGAPRGPRGAP